MKIIDLIIDDKYNAIVWDDDKLMKASDIFYDWFTNLSGIKQQYPSNYLVKHMMSYLWGYLISYKKEYYNEDAQWLFTFNRIGESLFFRLPADLNGFDQSIFHREASKAFVVGWRGDSLPSLP